MVLYVLRYVQPSVHYMTDAPYYMPDRAIDQFSSLIWCERFREPGEFSLYMRATPELLEYFYDRELLIVRPDTNKAMIPESVILTTSAENGNYLKISGRSAESALNHRVIMQTGSWTASTGTAEQAIAYYAVQNITRDFYYHPGDGEQTWNTLRYLPFMRYAAPDNRESTFPERIEAQPFSQNLGEFVSSTCKACGYGYDVSFDKAAGEMVLRVYRGTDRSLNQSVHSPVIFSRDFCNLGDTEYRRDRTSYRNYVYIAGEGEGKDRVINSASSVSVDENDPYYNRAMGMTRREAFVDAKSVSSNSSGIDRDPVKYLNLLYGIARDKAEESKEEISFTGSALPGGQFLYRRDYFLGDTVSARNEYGINGTGVISEVTEVFDETGHTVVPTISEWRT